MSKRSAREKRKKRGVRGGGKEDHFLKGLVVSLAYISTFSLFIIPVVWFIFTFVIGPFVAGYKGAKHTPHGMKLGVFVGLIWASVEVLLIIYFFSQLSIFGGVVIRGTEAAILFAVYGFNVLFCMLGGRLGASS